MSETPLKLLFICRHNAVRSQIAEVLATKLATRKVIAQSAGPEPTAVPDMVQQWAKSMLGEPTQLMATPLSEVEEQHFDLIITLCDKGHAPLPTINSDKDHIQWEFHHANDHHEIKQLEIEIAERMRLLFHAKHLL